MQDNRTVFAFETTTTEPATYAPIFDTGVNDDALMRHAATHLLASHDRKMRRGTRRMAGLMAPCSCKLCVLAKQVIDGTATSN